jgi:putative oxidoreductase
MIAAFSRPYDAAIAMIERAGDGWLLGLGARLVFVAVVFGYYWSSAMTKIGDGPLGLLFPSDGAYVQILPAQMEAAGYDSTGLGFLPWGLIVLAGLWAELLLPVLIALGLMTRLAALGMIGFIAVQSYVDVAFHGADAATLGALFDRIPGSVILDQRALWVFVLLVLAVKGAGALSLDAALARRAR